ncbi:MAG: hypothetical protein EP330_00010, partial [Deltaproteobacteria bacterium]
VYADISGYEADEATCDGEDNDCDGDVDTDIAGTPLADKQDGVCAGTKKVCDGGGGYVEPDYASVIATYETDETACDDLDNDCDASTDESLEAYAPEADKQAGVCAGAAKACISGNWAEPDYTLHSADYEPVESLCDGLDNDCDTVVDTTTGPVPDSGELYCWGETDERIATQRDEGPWVQVSLSRWWSHGCAIDESGGLGCWGYNGDGQLGDGTQLPRRRIDRVSGTWTHVSAGWHRTCGIQADQSLWCWGWRPAQPTTPAYWGFEPTRVGTATWLDVSAGANHTCAIDTDQAMWCWGANNRAQVGIDVTVTTAVAEPTQSVAGTFTKVSAGVEYTCAIDTVGDVRCWGLNWYDQLGVADLNGYYPTPVVVPAPTNLTWVDISAGERHTCALASDGSAWCWGENGETQLGVVSSGGPTPIKASDGPFDHIAAAGWRTCATGDTVGTWCWGSTSSADGLGGSDAYNYPGPTLIGATFTRDVSLQGEDTACVLDTDGALACWGITGSGNWQTGPGPNEVRQIAAMDVERLSDGGPSSGSAGMYGSHCLIDSDDALYCYGSSGTLGIDSPNDVAAPTLVSAGPFTEVSARSGTACAIDADGYKWCWGTNAAGFYGDGTSTSSAVPVRSTAATWSDVALGDRRHCGIHTDGTLWCWGLGIGATPAQQGTDTYTRVAAGYDHVCAIQATDGALVCWGRANEGQLGHGDTATLEFADRVTHPGPWTDVKAHLWRTCGIQDDQSLWCWGSNTAGQAGNGTTDPTPTPEQVPGQWTGFTVGNLQTCAIRADRTLWCWGSNANFELGRDPGGTGDGSLVPEQLPHTGWTAVGTSGNRTCAARYEFATIECPP